MTFNIFGKKIELGKELLAVFIIIIVFLAGLGGYLIVKSNTDIIIDSKNVVAEAAIEGNSDTDLKPATDTGEGSADETIVSSKKAEMIKIYVTGYVKKQGIVTIEKGQLIDDALRLAGGVTEEADIGNINLVYKLEENTMLYIKSKKELQKPNQIKEDQGEAGKGVNIVKDSGGVVINEAQKTSAAGGKININKATIDELDTLPGIGEATAQDIITYRDTNGGFKTIQDIMKVPRIKETRFEKIKNYITIE